MKDIVKSQIDDEYKVINGRKVKTRRRQRRSNLVTYCAIAVAVFSGIGLIVSLFFLFDVKEVKIEGVSLYTNEQIMLVGGVETGSNLIRTNTSVIENRLVETLPYIEKATVSKDYPNSLEISVVEATKCADIELNSRYYVISSNGILLETENLEHDGSLPLVKGFELKEPELNKKLVSEDSGKAKVLMQVLDSIKSSGIKGITVIDLTKRNDIVVYCEGRIVMMLGSSLDMDSKLVSMKAVIENELPNDYEGTLIYNGANSGISAISKEAREAAGSSSGEAAKISNGSLRMYMTHEFGEVEAKPYNGVESQPQNEAAEQPQNEGYTGWQ